MTQWLEHLPPTYVVRDRFPGTRHKLWELKVKNEMSPTQLFSLTCFFAIDPVFRRRATVSVQFLKQPG